MASRGSQAAMVTEDEGLRWWDQPHPGESKACLSSQSTFLNPELQAQGPFCRLAQGLPWKRTWASRCLGGLLLGT